MDASSRLPIPYLRFKSAVISTTKCNGFHSQRIAFGFNTLSCSRLSAIEVQFMWISLSLANVLAMAIATHKTEHKALFSNFNLTYKCILSSVGVSFFLVYLILWHQLYIFSFFLSPDSCFQHIFVFDFSFFFSSFFFWFVFLRANCIISHHFIIAIIQFSVICCSVTHKNTQWHVV